jgi:hypothetical protein
MENKVPANREKDKAVHEPPYLDFMGDTEIN